MPKRFYPLLLLLIVFLPGAAPGQGGQPPVYMPPTLENFSKLYWQLGKLDIENDEAIDNYMLINECDLYEKYYHNEFEWQQIRESGRQLVRESKEKFPTRFEVTQPLFLKDYDFKTGTFEVHDFYRVTGVRRYEILTLNPSATVCKRDIKNIPGYPRGIIAEFSRPLTVEHVKVAPDVARHYLDIKMAPFNALSAEEKARADIYDYRDAYLVLKIQFFAFKEDTVKDYLKYAQVLGVVESVEIYADKDRKIPLYTEAFRRSKSMSNMERELREAYESKKKGSENKAAPVEQ